jgi:hypothetical protein
MIREALYDLELKAPLHFSSTLTKAQLNFYERSVRLAGPNCHNLPFETYNVIYKRWITSTKNPGASIAKNYRLAEKVHVGSTQVNVDLMCFVVGTTFL